MNESDLRKQFVNKAIAYVGAKEGSSKHKYIIDTYNKIVPLPVGYKVTYKDAWCATFVSCIASLCGLLDIIPAECSCGRQIDLWKKTGRWQESDSYEPQAGDILYFDWQDSGIGDNKGASDHVGIVVSVSSRKIKVIEGNKNNTVGYRTLSVNGRYIRGFGLPDFTSKATKSTNSVISSSKESVCKVELKILNRGSKGNDVKALQALLIGYGYSVGNSGVDGSFGSDTLKAVKAFQKAKKIDDDGSVGPITWKHLLGVS